MVNLEYKFLVFLYAYMRQIDLSLDRCRWVPWSDLREYYQSQINPVVVSDQLFKNTNLRPETTPIVSTIKKPSRLRKTKDTFFRLIMKKQYLKDCEILYCSQLLHQFDLLLNRSFSEYPLEAEKLRIDIATFYSYVLEPKLSIKDYFRTMRVEHFMQSERIEVVNIDVFATNAQLQKEGN